ncbi:MAG: TatD family hydrolase [Alphaproteobacteria bacterium]|nr:TatD family hydrolase [Alphaproteobacteria bacterium]
MPQLNDSPKLIDSHCHLDYYRDSAESEAVIARAFAADIGIMLSISVTLGKHPNIMQIVEKHDDIYASVGLHPCHVAEEELSSCADLIAIAAHQKVIAIGESGLDYFKKPIDEARQKQSFAEHIKATQQTGLPLIVHNRAADDDVMTMLEQAYKTKAFPCILHCFAASEQMMKRAVSLGFYISFSGILTFKNSDELRHIAAQVPQNLLLIETDSPYLAPQAMRGKRNEPQYIHHTVETLAQQHGVSKAEMVAITSANFLRLMSKIPQNLYQNIRGSDAD